jgi:cytochrome c nitrite reductase small subunit
MSRILQESCQHCHAALVHDLVARTGREEDEVRCVHCHRSVGHGETTGLGR